MARSQTTRAERLLTALLFMVASFAFCGAVCGWLTDADLAGQIWPDDINRAILQSLGGSVAADALGQPAYELGWVSVWLRLLVVTGVALVIDVYRHADIAARRLQAAVRSSIVMAISAGWWLLWLAGDLGIGWAAGLAVGSLPLWISVTTAFLAWIWGGLACAPPASDLETDASRQRGPIVLLLACTVGWVAVSFWMNFCLYQQLFIPHGDSGMYEEHLWNVWHGKGFRSYLDQGLFLGEHLQVIHLFLLPVHMLWPSQLLLELAESLALASCSVPIYLMVRRHTGSPQAAALLGIAWLFYFPMHFLDIAIDQKTFRPIALGLPFLFWLIEFSERRRFGMAFLCLLAALSAKEDMALMTFPLMCVMAGTSWRQARGQQSPGNTTSDITVTDRAATWRFAGMAAFSAFYLVVAVLVVIPAFRSGDVVHYARYFGDLGDSPGELVRTALTHPLKIILELFSTRTLLYVLVFLSPLAFTPARRPGLLLAGLLTFGMLALIQLGDAVSGLPPVPYHHFHAPLLPVLFWAVAWALGSQDSRQPASSRFRWRLSAGAGDTMESKAWLVVLCCVCTSVTGSLMPCGVAFWSAESPFGLTRLYRPTAPDQLERAAMAKSVVDQIPKTARVAATDYIHVRLTHCERSYDYSDYLRRVNNYQPGVPPDTEYIVIDTGHRYSRIRSADDVPELADEDAGWRLLPDTTNGKYLILQRTTPRRRTTQPDSLN